MSAVRNNNRSYNDSEPPANKIVSEADIFIKKLTNKQQIRKIDLHEILKKEQNFEKTSEYVPHTNSCSGILPLDKFKSTLAQFDCMDDLRACSLSNEEIKLIMDYKNNVCVLYKNIEPSILQSRIEKIIQLVEQHKQKKQTESSSNNISRKQNELLSVKPNSIETKLLKFALQNEIKHTGQKSHVLMDNIKFIEKNLFSHLQEETVLPSKIQKRLRKYSHQINSKISPTNQFMQHQAPSAHSFVNNSKWDLKNEDVNSKKLSLVVPTEKLCAEIPQHYYTLQNGEIIKLNQNNELKHIQISENKLSIEEIKKLSQFKNYEIGIPSRILYLKNLPKYIQESDLHELFNEFNPDTLSFRVMTGKMKGQVFITFPDVATAVKALHSMNGMVVCEKPIVIEFGRRSQEYM